MYRKQDDDHRWMMNDFDVPLFYDLTILRFTAFRVYIAVRSHILLSYVTRPLQSHEYTHTHHYANFVTFSLKTPYLLPPRQRGFQVHSNAAYSSLSRARTDTVVCCVSRLLATIRHVRRLSRLRFPLGVDIGAAKRVIPGRQVMYTDKRHRQTTCTVCVCAVGLV